MRFARTAAGLAAAGLLLAGCGSASAGGDGAGSAGPSPSGHGPVRVLYAGSLVNVMEKAIGTGFHRATGYDFRGEGKGSQALANEIKGRVAQADVFISASTSTNALLRGTAGGDWVSWYATFASSPLVLGYNPKSRFASELKTKPWPQVVAGSGFRLGRTDPDLDPKGKLAVQALKQVGLPDLATGTDGVFPEETLVGRLGAGQLDAGFFYTSEAAEQKIATVPLDPVKLSATYTVTVLNRAPDQAGAVAFVRYLLGPAAPVLKQHGLRLQQPPTLAGDRAAVPAELRSVLPGA